MRSEKDIRLRIDLLEGQAATIAKMLAKAMQEHNEEAVRQYSEKLALVKSRVEEQLWVLGVKSGIGILASTVTVRGADMTIGDVLEKIKSGELKMDELAPDVQAMVRKGALEMQNALRHST